MATLPSRPQIKYDQTAQSEAKVAQAVADHDKFVFATVPVSNATNASNGVEFDQRITLVDNKGTVLGYIPVMSASW